MPEKPVQPDHNSPFWTVAQISRRWQCSERKIRRLIKKGELVAHRFDGQLRIAEADLRGYERLHREDSGLAAMSIEVPRNPRNRAS